MRVSPVPGAPLRGQAAGGERKDKPPCVGKVNTISRKHLIPTIKKQIIFRTEQDDDGTWRTDTEQTMKLR